MKLRSFGLRTKVRLGGTYRVMYGVFKGGPLRSILQLLSRAHSTQKNILYLSKLAANHVLMLSQSYGTDRISCTGPFHSV